MAGREIAIYDEEGNQDSMFIANIKDRVRKDGANNSHPVIGKLVSAYKNPVKANIILQIDEAALVSKEVSRNEEHSHQWMDEKGWIFRKLYAEDAVGDTYIALMNIANGRDRKTLYEINIKKIDRATKSIAQKGETGVNVDFAKRIPSEDTKVKENRKSIEVDTEGHKLSTDQAKYFENSKAVDKDGNLIVMYHGTYEDFDTFKSNEFVREINGDNLIKGYFSEDKDFTTSYGEPKAYYLNITNPLEIGNFEGTVA